MKHFKLLVAFLVVCTSILTSCEKENDIVGTWNCQKVEIYYNGVLSRTRYYGEDDLESVTLTYIFSEDGKYTERGTSKYNDGYTKTGTYFLSEDKKTLTYQFLVDDSLDLKSVSVCFIKTLNKEELVFETLMITGNYDSTGVFYFTRQ
ncbi:MAG: lipocalin family protein [Paludibacteraceae bacterium]